MGSIHTVPALCLPVFNSKSAADTGVFSPVRTKQAVFNPSSLAPQLVRIVENNFRLVES
jgi:hypothetical protein